jgi:YVTN family beta-propeller protein
MRIHPTVVWSTRRRWTATVAAVAAVGVGAGTAVAVNESTVVGPRPDGTAVTSYGWTVTPAGEQVTLGDKPFGTALSPDGQTLLVSNDGQSTQSLSVVDTGSGEVRQTISYTSPEALFVGLAFSPDGRHAYASAGGNNKIRTYDVHEGGTLTESASLPLPPTNPAGTTVNHFPAGITVSPDGLTLWSANSLSHSVSIVDLAAGTARIVPVGSNPFAVALSPDGGEAYVSDWGEQAVTVLDAASGAVTGTVHVGTHPSALKVNATRDELYVADTDSDQVSVISLASDTVTRTVHLSPYKGAPVGTNPNALAVTPDGATLYVADAGANEIAVVRVGQKDGQDRVEGRIPTGWYPTGVEVARDADTLFVTNAKGLGAGPNPGGPNPYADAARVGTPGYAVQFVGSMIKGTLSVVPVPDREMLARYTRQTALNDNWVPGPSGGGEDANVAGQLEHGARSVIPRRAGDPTPIKHEIYVVKENRTYDQVFGSLGKGNGDPALNLFDDSSAPNLRQLARQFVTLDNTYAAAEVSADGWNWSTAATANTYTQKTWEANYSDKPGRNHSYEYEGGTYATAPGSDPHQSYIWDYLDQAGVDYRNYGFWRLGAGPVAPTAPNLAAHTDPAYQGYDLNTTDQSRMDEYTREFRGFESSGSMPTMQLVRLPSDHTQGTKPGAPTPRAMVADNDLAVGRLVDLVSHSQFWKDTAIFVVEDDAQAGPDHVDAHRMESLVISPYTQTGKVDSTFYSTVSVLRTIELLTGLPPMTQFDASAVPMLNAFSGEAHLQPYTAIQPQQSLTETNSAQAPLAADSAAMDFTNADRADAQTLNDAIWQSVNGAGSAPPTGRAAAANAGAQNDGDG